MTTTMGLLGDIAADVRRIRELFGRSLARKRKFPKMTAEEKARRDKHQEMLRERIAYHEEKAREREEARRRATG